MPSTINAQPGNSTAFTALIKSGASDANLAFETNGIDAVVIDNNQNANFVATGSVTIPRGTTDQRPSPAVNGMIRFNTTTLALESYVGDAWQIVTQAPYTATYILVAGGGGSGGNGGGGGGGGGLLANSVTLTVGTEYTITIGAGSAASNAPTAGLRGGNSSAFGVTVVGGGNGGAGNGADAEFVRGKNGGSGGGAHRVQTVGTGVAGQGFAGGQGTGSGVSNAGGGGGAGAVGSNATGTDIGGIGGIGFQSSITGTAIYYAGGGGGGGGASGGGAGGLGGSGAGGAQSVSGANGTANLGGGGGGGGDSSFVSTAGGNGGSGVVIFSIPTAFYTGTTTGSPTVTTLGSNTILQFTASGTYTA